MTLSGSLPKTFNFKEETRTYLSVLLHGQQESESFEGKTWRVVNSEIDWVGNANTLWLSLGSDHSREKIYFDENLPQITALKEKACKACKGKPIPVILDTVNNLVNKLSAIRNKNITDTEAILDIRLINLLGRTRVVQQRNRNESISLKMETLLKERTLVCRHKALIAASLLRELVERKILPSGKVRQFRESITQNNTTSGHTWAVYRDMTTGHLWICDPRFRMVRDVHQSFTELENYYNRRVMCSMIERLDRQDLFVSIFNELAKHQIPFEIKEVPSKTQIGYPGLQICLAFNDEFKHFDAFHKALEKQNISFIRLGYSIYIPLYENPSLFYLDGEKLLRDSGIYQQFNSLIYLPPELQPDSLIFRKIRQTTEREKHWDEFLEKHRQPRIRC